MLFRNFSDLEWKLNQSKLKNIKGNIIRTISKPIKSYNRAFIIDASGNTSVYNNEVNIYKPNYVGLATIPLAIAITLGLVTGCKAKPITQEEIIETKPPVTETVEEIEEAPEVVEEVKDPLQEKLEKIANKYSLEFANKLETIEDKQYLEAILDDNKVLTSMSFFYNKEQFDKLLPLKPSFKSWNDLRGILSGRSDDIINEYVDESIEYSGKMGALIINCGLNTTDYESAFFKYFFKNNKNIPTTIIQNKSDDGKMRGSYAFYSRLQSYPLIKELVDEIAVPNDFVKRDLSKEEILEEIASQISNPETKLDVICITSDYNTTEKGIVVSSFYKIIYPKELTDLIKNNYVGGKKATLLFNFCYPLNFYEDTNLPKNLPITIINSTEKRAASGDDLPESFFALADKGITLKDLKKFGDDSTVNLEFEDSYDGRTYNRKMSIFDFGDFELWIDNNDLMNFEPNVISNEEISINKLLFPYDIEHY